MEATDVGAASARPGAAVAIGNFDGVHKGHRLLVARAIASAGTSGLRSVVLTFDRHPATVVRPGSTPKLLTSVEHKLELLRATGVDEVVVLRFDEDRAAESAEDFVCTVLVGDLRARVVVVGASFRFGHGQGGDVALLESMGRDLGFDVARVELVTDDLDGGTTIVSSSLVRSLVAGGQLGAAASLLGRPFEVRAPLVEVREDGAGALLQLVVPPALLAPPPGVYVGDVRRVRGEAVALAAQVLVAGDDPVVLSVHLAGGSPGSGAATPQPGDAFAIRFEGPSLASCR